MLSIPVRVELRSVSSDQVYTGVSNKVLSACPKLIKNQLTGLLDNMKKKVLCQARKFGGNWQLTSGREEVLEPSMFLTTSS